MEPLTKSTENELQEKMWIEIIESMERMYAKLAEAQTEMEKKNADLGRANEVVRNVIESMINALVVADRHGVITLANDACSRTMGYKQGELLGAKLSALFPADAPHRVCPHAPLWNTLLEEGALRDVETEILLADGQAIPVSVNASILRATTGDFDGALLVAYDLRPLQKALNKARAEAEETERAYRELKAIQAKLIHSEKMSSLGRMAAGVAHEINNPLGAILVYSHLLLEEAPEKGSERETLQKIIRETTRCKEIVQELLGFSRTQQGKWRVMSLDVVVRSALELVRPQPLFQDIERDVQYSPEPLFVET